MKRTGILPALVIGAVLGLLVGSAPLLAQPGNGQGSGQEPWKASGKGQGKEQRGGGQGHPGQGKGQEERQGSAGKGDRYHQESRERHEVRDREHGDHRDRERDGYRDRDRDRDRYRDEARWPRIDEREVREIFRSRREYLHHDDVDSLPPGIRMNLARGKPLPPGIAKKFDDRVRRDLPHYDGYEWRRVGTDAVLVDLTNDIIYEVIHDLLR